MVLMMMIAVASEAGLDATMALESALRFGDCFEICVIVEGPEV